MLTVHHLGKSQSERIVWLCEELAIPYELVVHDRDSVTGMGPPALKALHPIGGAPVIADGDLLLAESGAIVDYIIAKHGGGRLAAKPEDADFADYLYWFHFANGTLQPGFLANIMLRMGGVAADHPVAAAAAARHQRAIGRIDARLAAVPWLAGERFSAAEIMSVFTLTTARHFLPLDLAPFPAIRAWLKRIGARPAYQAAMAKGDPGMALLLE